MRMRVTARRGMSYARKFYAQGDEFELIGKDLKMQAAALIAGRKAENADPEILGSPPPLPRRRGRPPLSARPATAPEPVADATEGARTKQTATTEEEAAKPAELEAPKEAQEPALAPIQPQRARTTKPAEPTDSPAAAAEDGTTYQRRDLRAEE